MFGKIKHKTAKGFAFARPNQAGSGAPLQDYFLHRTEFLGDWEQLQAGDLIEFTPGIRRGNPIALDVRLLAEPAEVETSEVRREQK
jgi:hypothetical protein